MTVASPANVTAPANGSQPHVLFLPKWWPNADDPQLGDFIRKQAQATASAISVSVLYIHAEKDPNAAERSAVIEEGALWELHRHYRASEHGWKPIRQLLNLIRYWQAAMLGWNELVRRRGQPDLIHAHILVRPAVVAYWLGKRHGIPYVVSEQSSEYLDGTYGTKGILFKAVSRFLFQRAADVTVVSAWLGDALKRLGLVTNYEIVPNVIPGLDRPLPPKGAPGQFLVVADLVDKTKNVSGVLRALAKARASDKRLQLNVIGDGPDRSMLDSLVNSLGLQASVTFLGRLPNAAVLDHVAQAAAMVVNSNVETFSVVTGEALAQGKPVIATRCGGPIAFVVPANGILIDVGDEEALVAAMLQLTNDHDRYDPTDIRHSISSRSSPEAVSRGFVRIYTRILAQDNER